MYQIAVFVDAGYVHGQGSALLAGHKQPRRITRISSVPIMSAIKEKCAEVAPEARLLRVYWYDGLLGNGRQTPEQQEVALSPLTKLRLGVVNSQGEQKEVDSLIVTDMIELARNRAVSDVLLISGDGDIRVGMQIAQTFGVQAHLLGIKPALGSQSPWLVQEADTHHEWLEAAVASFLTIGSEETSADRVHLSRDLSEQPRSFEDAVEIVVQEALTGLSETVAESVRREFRANPASVPPIIDRPILGKLGYVLKSDLSPEQRKQLRELLKEKLRSF
jgi:hypothetical protein